MNVALFVPPLCDPTQPSLGVSSISAYLKKNKRHNAYVLDYNIAWFNHLLNPDVIISSLNAKECKNIIKNFSSLSLTSVILNIHKSPSIIYKLITKIISVFKSGNGFYNGYEYRTAKESLRLLGILKTFKNYPCYCDLSYLSWEDEYFNLDLLYKEVIGGEHNPFYEFTLNLLSNQHNLTLCQLFGISVTFETQWLGAFTLAYLLKCKFPNIPIVFGGAILSYVASELLAYPSLSDLIDWIVIHKGEYALNSILDNISKGKPPEEIPNVLSKKKLKTSLYHESLSVLPVPNFEELSLKDYFSPSPVLPLIASQGCEWGKCSYCDLGAGYNEYEARPAEKIASDMSSLFNNYGVSHFNFLTDSLHYLDANNIAITLFSLFKSKMKWSTDLRLSPAYNMDLINMMYKSGCALISPGLETTSNRVFKLANKGQNIQNIEATLKRFHKSGIKVTFQVMMGFPSETPTEMRDTIAFLLKNKNCISFIVISEFLISKFSPIGINPEKWGINYDKDSINGLHYCTPDFFSYMDNKILHYQEEVKNCMVNARKIIPLETFPYTGSDCHSLLLSSNLSMLQLKRFSREYYKADNWFAYLD